ncbi:MAG TPA: JAB domain-containing protein [Verrucomicrobiae bacterium]|nr:JAB domain-containing protein [Verrucomicrobiae bacterium]
MPLLAGTSPPLAFKKAGDTGPEYRNRRADIKVTRDLIRGGQLLEVEILDHVIVGNGNRPFLHALGYFLPPKRSG